MFKNFPVIVDTVQKSKLNNIVVNSNDLKTIKLSLTINQLNKPIDLTGATVRIAIVKPDKKTVFQDCTITDPTTGTCEVVLNTQAFIISGVYIAEVMIYFGADTVAVTGRFSYSVTKGILDDSTAESTNEWQSITQAIADAEGILIDLRDNGTGIDAQARTDLQTVTTQLEDNAKKTNERPGLIPRPSNFPWKNPPIMIKKDTFGKYTVVFDIERFVPANGKAYYVDINTGNDANDGLTATTAFKSMFKALQQADARIIYVAPGVYDRIRGWIKTNPASGSLVIKPLYKGDIIFGTHQDGLAWTVDGTVANVYKASRSSTMVIYDSLILDEYGDHTQLTKKASIAEVGANPGSWYSDGTNVYVRLKDDRVPDNSVRVYVTGGNGYVQGTRSVYMEGIKFYGGDNPFDTLTASSSEVMKLYFKNCEFKYGIKGDGAANGLNIKGTKEVILQGCIAAKNQRDGFNYHVYTSIIPNAIEIDCIAYHNGLNDANDNNNGSTMHDAGNIIRVNGTYFKNKGPNAIDVGGCNAWNVGCVSYDSLSVSDSSNVNFLNQDGKMWLDGCVSYDSVADVVTVGTGVTYAKRTLTNNELFETGIY